MRKATILILTAAVMMLSSCVQSFKVDSAFLASTSTGLTLRGQSQFEYNELTCQTAFNRERCEFRVHTDNMSDYYCLTLDRVPANEGDKVKGDIIWTSTSEVVSKTGLTFMVEQVDRNGRFWLWCKREGIGALVQITD